MEAKACNRRGDALILLGQIEDAIALYDLALALTPEDSYILYNRGRAWALLGNTKKHTPISLTLANSNINNLERAS